MGEVYLQSLQFDKAIVALTRAESLGDNESYPRLLKAKGWTAHWSDFERLTARVEKEAQRCHGSRTGSSDDPAFLCRMDSASGLEYTDVNGSIQKMFHSKSPNAQPSKQSFTKQTSTAMYIILAKAI
jgi:hypothetical protein